MQQNPLWSNFIYPKLDHSWNNYGVEVWHPYLSKDTQALENVQKFALRICSNNWQANYHDLLEHYNLPTLENRRLYLSLCTFFKIVHKLS